MKSKLSIVLLLFAAGIVNAQTITVFPASINLGNIFQGAPNEFQSQVPAETFTVRHSSSNALDLSIVASAPFIVQTSSIRVLAGETRSITVTFDSSVAIKSHSGTLTVTGSRNGAPAGSAAIQLLANVIASLKASPQPFTFGDVLQGSTFGTNRDLVFENLGSLPLPVKLTPFGPFSITPTSITVTPGLPVTTTVTLLNTTVVGPQSGRIETLVSGGTTNVNITANIVSTAAPDLTVSFNGSPHVQPAGNKKKVTVSLVIHNTGAAVSQPCATVVRLGNEFRVLSIIQIAPGQQVQKQSTFQTSQTGTVSLTVDVDSDSKNSEVSENNNLITTDVSLQ